MRYVTAAALALVAGLAIGAVAAASASASPEWFECAEVSGTGAFKDASCSEADATKKSNFERVSIVPTKFTTTSGSAKLQVETNLITCKTKTSSGEIEAPKNLKKVVVVMKECKGEETETKKTCEVKSTSPVGGKEEVVMNSLKGEVGKVSKTEAASEVGVLLTPESGSVLTTVEGSCFSPITKASLEGGVIGELAPAGKAQTTAEIAYGTSGKKQKIQKLEGGAQKVLKVTVLGIGIEAPFEGVDNVTPENAEIGVGEQVVARPNVLYAWKVKTAELMAGQKKEIKELKANVSGITIQGKDGATAFTVKCTSLLEEGAPAPKPEIFGGRPGILKQAWKLTGCTMPTPANCAIMNSTIKPNELEGFIGTGVGRSANKILLRLVPLGNNPFMVIEAVNSGGVCALGNVTVTGGPLAEALDPTDELFHQEFQFEPAVKNTWATLEDGKVTRFTSGLFVGVEHVALSGALIFAIFEGGGHQEFSVN